MLLLKKFRRATLFTPAVKLVAGGVLHFSLVSGLIYTQHAIAQADDAWDDIDVSRSHLEATLEATDYNAYDQRLVDPLVVQARQLQESGSHTEAVTLFKEAIHILRVNHGLYNDSQIELLDAMIESEISLQNWELVNQHYGYMEHLYKRLYAVNDPRLETGLQKVVTWHVNALNVNLDGKRIEHLQQANRLFKLRLQIAQLTLQTDDPKFDFLNRNIEICERQLFLASDLNREMQRRQQRARQNALLADLD